MCAWFSMGVFPGLVLGAIAAAYGGIGWRRALQRRERCPVVAWSGVGLGVMAWIFGVAGYVEIRSALDQLLR